MDTKWRIMVFTKNGRFYADDVADNEEEARKQAGGWTGQRGQMTWTAKVHGPEGQEMTFKRGVEVLP